jgi:hypothetical protein
MKGTLRICPSGHKYYKSSDCPTCPVCEGERRPDTGFLSLLAAPARRAMQNAGITNLKQLDSWTEGDLLKLHGIGPTTIPKLKKALKASGRSFAKE